MIGKNILKYSNIFPNYSQFKKPKLANPEIVSKIKYSGPTREEVSSLRKKFLNPALVPYYKEPLLIVEGNKQYLFDEKGKRYLDCFAGIVTVSVGHCHPRIVKVLSEQIKKLMHTTCIYLHDQPSLFGKELSEKLPGKLKNIYFVNSGSEASDLAILMARLYTKNIDLISLRNGYHGGGMSAMAVTSLGTWKYPANYSIGHLYTMNPNIFRGAFKLSDGLKEEQCAEKYANDVKDIIDHCTPGQVAGFIAETIQGVGGSVTLPNGYLKQVYKYVREKGGVCIADEVQTAFGRTGKFYWGFENQGVIPDIVTMAKGIGNGFPLAAVACTDEIAQVMSKKNHFNTFGGNPMACAVGREVLKVIDDEKLQNNALVVGDYLKNQFLKLKDKFQIIGDVRGKGLMLGVELVKNRKTLEPASAEVLEIFEKLKSKNILVGKGGLYANVFRIKPPLCFSKDNADELLFNFEKILKDYY